MVALKRAYFSVQKQHLLCLGVCSLFRLLGKQPTEGSQQLGTPDRCTSPNSLSIVSSSKKSMNPFNWSFGSAYTKIGTIQRRLAWQLEPSTVRSRLRRAIQKYLLIF